MSDLHIPTNPYQKDAEAAGKYLRAYLSPRRRGDFGASEDVIAWLARWAGHWGRLALNHERSKR